MSEAIFLAKVFGGCALAAWAFSLAFEIGLAVALVTSVGSLFGGRRK